MAKARAIVKRRKAVAEHPQDHPDDGADRHRPVQKALDRATEAEAYTRKIAELVADLGETSAERRPPAAREARAGQAVAAAGPDQQPRAWPAATTATSSASATRTYQDLAGRGRRPSTRGLRQARRSPSAGSAGIPIDATYTQFEDRPQFDEVEKLADRYIAHVRHGARSTGSTWPTPEFINAARQDAVVADPAADADRRASARPAPRSDRPKPRPPATAAGAEGRARPLRVPARRPGASSRRSCRSRSRSGCSSASSTRPSASRSPGWSPCEGRPRTPTTWSRR